MSFLKHIKNHKKLYLVIAFAIAYFLYKGLIYAFIGSMIPLLVITLMCVLLYKSYLKSMKLHYKVVRFWAVLVLLWAISRLFLWVIFSFNTSLTESHIREQFTILSTLISLIMLTAGWVMFKTSKQLLK